MRTYFTPRNGSSRNCLKPFWRSCFFLIEKTLLIFTVLIIGFPLESYASPFEGIVHPCECTSYTTLGTDIHSTTSLIEYGTLSPYTCYIVHGRLLVDVADTWTGCSFLMTEGSDIYIEDPLTVSECWFSSCDNEMWVGMTVSGYGDLDISDSYIEGAGNAINLLGGASFECKNNTFINDYLGIAVGLPWEEDGHGNMISMRRPITG